jgi:amino acid adenylation domain-containing protein
MMNTEIQGYPLSRQQQRLWEQHAAGARHLACLVADLHGDLDRRALKDALCQVMARHEILRTRFEQVPGLKLPLQVIDPPRQPRWSQPRNDGGQATRSGAIQRHLARARRDSAEMGVLRASLTRLAAGHHALILGAPSLCADARSLELLLTETALVYGGGGGNLRPISDLAQYTSYAEWQKSLNEDDAAATAREFWASHDLGQMFSMQLPLEEPASDPSAPLLTAAVPLSPETVSRLESSCQAAGCAPEAFLLACWAILLRRLAGREEWIIGVQHSGRPFEELHQALGPFAHFIPTPCRFEGSREFADVLARVEDFQFQAEPWLDYFSWDLIAGADRGVAAFGCPYAFSFETVEPQYLGGGLTVIPGERLATHDRCRLHLRYVQYGSHLACEIDYDRRAFSSKSLLMMARFYANLVDAFAHDPGRRIKDIPVISGAAREQLLLQAKGASAPLPEESFPEAFARIAGKYANHVAIMAADGSATYRELNSRADRVAEALRYMGVQPESRVALCMDRSLDAVVGLLGIVKAGAAYAPLAPDLPPARLATILRDLHPDAIVTNEHLASRLETLEIPVLRLDSHTAETAAALNGNTPAPPDPANSLYIIHTSGSSGRPKAVGITHRNLLNYVQSVRRTLAETSGRPLAFASVSTLSADLGNTSVFLSLLSGGCLHLIDYDTGTDPSRLAGYMRTHEIDVLKITPPHFRALLASGAGREVIPRCLILGGESLSEDLAAQIQAARPGCRIIHHYGPTETTVGCLTQTVSKAAAGSARPIPVGRPLANYSAYICDESFGIVPEGVPGQLFIGGEGVARGYLNDPVLTAERFVPDAFAQTPGGRLYATGDRARYLPGGAIEFLGRADRQAKIRGFRVEPGEVEAALRRDPRVQDAAVILIDRDEEKELAAYLVPAVPADPEQAIDAPSRALALDTSAIRETLLESLPAHMVPASFTVLAAMPLTRNGKIDYERLRRLQPASAATQALHTGGSPIATMVAELWAENLGIERVGPQDNYFELGGHSLLAMRLMSRLRQIFNVDVPLSAIFERPTPALLAEALEDALREAAGLAAPAIVRRPREGPVPVSFGQRRLWFLHQLDPNPSYNVPVSLRLRGQLNLPALQRATAELVRRHEILRTTFEMSDGQPVQIIHPPEPDIALPLIDLGACDHPGRDIEAWRIAGEEARGIFDLRQGPLLRGKVVRLEETEHVLLVTMHHIVSDAWSRDILLREFMTIYAAICEARDPGLPEIEFQYADYVLWQREWLQGQVLDEQLNYWKAQLAGAPALELPTDRPRSTVQTSAGSAEVLLLPKELCRALSQLGRSEGATLYMTLLAAFQALLQRYTGQDYIVVGSPIAGRNRTETEGLIGFFLNMLALRTKFEGNPGFTEVLRSLRETALGAYTHQDLPFERLVEELNPERDMSRSPLLQAVFDLKMDGRSVAEDSWHGLNVDYYAPVETGAKFDLLLTAIESEAHLQLAMAYNSDLFEAATIRRMLAHFHNLLQGIVADPQQPLLRIPILSPDEQRRPDEAASVPARPDFASIGSDWIEQSIGACFLAQARAHSERIAVKTPTCCWTYGELAARATALAHALAPICGSQSATIALLFDHDAPMLAAILGTLLAGHCYVPLDPHHPDQRLDEIIEDCQPAAIVTTSMHADRAMGLAMADQPVVEIDHLDLAPNGYSLPDVGPDRLAYILYTSGTEGRPKGVVQNHRNVLHFIRVYANNLRITGEDRLTLFSSYGADAAVMDIFGCLLLAATLYPIDLRQESNLSLRLRVANERITILHSTPTVFSHITDGMSGVPWPEVRLIVLGGEEALATHLRTYQEHFAPTCTLINGLGPTESTLALQYVVTKDTHLTRTTIPVGYPVDDNFVLLLNHDSDVPDVRGEICIQSRHVALGYWRNPELSRKAFQPSATEPGLITYRTGDMGRLLPDGSILYLGRQDAQVKINGFRVELGDVQAALNQHPDVLESAVVCTARGDTAELVAFFIPRGNPAPETVHLRQFMQKRLPGYMTPALFAPVEAFPRKANGKLDTSALLAATALPIASEAPVTPRDLVEIRLAQIWRELLPAPVFGVDTDFFQAGGSSFSAIRLLARIEHVFGVRLPLAKLFQGPSIEALGCLIRQDSCRPLDRCIVPLQPAGTKSPFFCVHPVGGTAACYAALARALGTDRPFFGLQHPGLADDQIPATIEELATLYTDEMIRVQSSGSYRIGGWSFGGVVAYEVAQQMALRGYEVERLILFDTAAPGTIPGMPGGRPPEMDDADLLMVLLGELPLSIARLRELDTPGQMAYVLEVARSERVVPPDFTVDQAMQLFAIAKANTRALRRYIPQPYGGTVTLFVAAGQPDPRGPERGWTALLTGPFEIRTVPGRHDDMINPPHTQPLARELQACLDCVRCLPVETLHQPLRQASRVAAVEGPACAE